MVNEYPAITYLERIEELIASHSNHIKQYRNRGTQEDHREEIKSIRKAAKKLHKLLDRNRLKLHIPNLKEFQTIRQGHEMTKLAADKGAEIDKPWPGNNVYLYSALEIRDRLLPTLEAITHTRERPITTWAMKKAGLAYGINDLRRPFVKGLLDCWDYSKERPEDLINFLYDCFKVAGDKLERSYIEKEVLPYALKPR